MRYSKQTLFVALFAAPVLLAQAEPESLFNGKSFEGWRHTDSHFRIEGGAIVGEIPKGEQLRRNLFLFWEGELHDFELSLEYRISGHPSANSGVQFRSQMLPNGDAAGYQADIDDGAVWLGRIYDEHGRALISERGTRVRIAVDGKRSVEKFKYAGEYKALARKNEWNRYRIRAVGPKIETFVNGQLASDLTDEQVGQLDFSGKLAIQLHSGPGPAKIEFRKIVLKRLGKTEPPKPPPAPSARKRAGIEPKDKDGKTLNLGFELGTLEGWKASGTAWDRQPIEGDTVTPRRPGQASRHVGKYWVGGYEIFLDAPQGALESEPFEVTHPYGSYLVGGGPDREARVDIIEADSRRVIHSASGQQLENMFVSVVDLRGYLGKNIAVRVIDETSGPWGHVNYDDFRFHETLTPELRAASLPAAIRDNSLLTHLEANPAPAPEGREQTPGERTVSSFYLPEGFRADLIAEEPRVLQPIAFTIDERGRLWVAEAMSYPQKRAPGAGLDRISIFEDTDGDGTFETKNVFAQGLDLVSGLEIGYGGVWVGAAPELLFIPDANRDDVPDANPTVVLDGWGFQDTHETLNNFVWGPDGWLYGNQGVFNRSLIGPPGAKPENRELLYAGVWRFHPIRKTFEVFAHGGSNQWGLDFDERGEFFMTHCRSFFGGGPTTHVVRNGHYWNQANARHAPFVSGEHPADAPHFRNFLRASARYGHGEGGAGKPGSRAKYGGHSHVGTMIYLGDNWPKEYRGDLYTHNLHGHRINRQSNKSLGSGFDTVHAGKDFLYVQDDRYIAVDLDYGPDGSVFIIDWYDRQHCHSPHMERWDRSNGRIYRVSYTETFRPRSVDLSKSSDLVLAQLHEHENAWYSRTARRLLHERSSARAIEKDALRALEGLLGSEDATKVLRAVWTLDVIGHLSSLDIEKLLASSHEHVRAWAIRLATDDDEERAPAEKLVELARTDPSPVVRLALASAIPRFRAERAWKIAEELVKHEGDDRDTNLPRMIWCGIAPHVEVGLDRALKLADSSKGRPLEEWIWWYASKTERGLERVVALLGRRGEDHRHRLLRALQFARAGAPLRAPPKSWRRVADTLYRSTNSGLRSQAEALGALFSDAPVLAELRRTLADASAPKNERRAAFDALVRVSDAESVEVFQMLVDESSFRFDAIGVLGRFDHARTPKVLLERMGKFSIPEQRRVVGTLSSRASYAVPLLEAMASGNADKRMLNSLSVRQLRNLGDKRVNELLAKVWGEARETSKDRQELIARHLKTYREAPLWAYSAGAGRVVFDKNCASCHESKTKVGNLGPDLRGAGKNGAEYFLESVVDPNAVVGEDFQMMLIVTNTGTVISGVVQEETAESVTIRTPDDRIVVPRASIISREKKNESVMPEGLLDALSKREIIELLKYLSSI